MFHYRNVSLSTIFGILLLRTVHPQPLPKSLLELFLARLARASTKHQLAPQLVGQGDVPVLRRFLVDDGVVVLQVGTETLRLERDPKSVLVHGVGVFGPVAKVVGVEGKSLSEVLSRFGVFVEEDLSPACQCVSELSQAIEVVT
jgi:hypothetical protein